MVLIPVIQRDKRDYNEPTHDSVVAKIHRKMHPGMSWCLRCGYPWGMVKEHSTRYNDSEGCFPLCEGCWVLLGCPEARIEYYKTLIDWWEAIGSSISKDTKRDIQRAVANGG
jgi:hypothetical protein